MRVNMKEPVELEPMKIIDEIPRFLNKELRLTKVSMGALPISRLSWDMCWKKKLTSPSVPKSDN